MVTKATCDTAPLVPVTATWKVASGVTLGLDTVRFTEPLPVSEAALRVGTTPGTVPMTVVLKATTPLNPLVGRSVTVKTALDPLGTLATAGEATSAKFAPAVTGASASIRFCPVGEPQPVTRS